MVVIAAAGKSVLIYKVEFPSVEMRVFPVTELIAAAGKCQS
jgi:hypothetical protein